MLRMLIAENGEMIRKGLAYTTDQLSMDCVVVAEVTDNRDGYERIPECRPDVIIADICTPFTGGIEMIKRISEQVRFRNILLTSYVDFEYTRRVIEARVCEYLLKPVGEEALTDVMERLGEEIVSSRQVEYVIEQTEIEGGNPNLGYYMQLDLSENQHVFRVIEAIREGFARKLSMESISDDLGVNASYLSRKFKEVTGQTFLNFLNKYRVQQAIMMLGTRRCRISEVSGAAGFTDCKHFCSVFRKYTSESPTKFIEGVP